MIYRGEFPNLRDDGFTPKSDPSEAYNCIAWGAGFNDRIWDPDEDHYWPIDDREYTVACLIAAFSHLGFVQCDNGAKEDGIQKVAIYGNQGVYEHAARQLRDGSWTSKLGPEDDIWHLLPDSLCGGNYGQLVAYMKRPYPPGAVLGDPDTDESQAV